MSNTTELISALRAGQQADRDGVMVCVSRQACDEAADALTALQKQVAEQAAQIEALKLAEEGAKVAFGHVVQDKKDRAAECQRTLKLLHSAHDIIRRNAAEIASLRAALTGAKNALVYHQEQTRPISQTSDCLIEIDAAMQSGKAVQG